MGRFKGRLWSKGWVNSVIINEITEINYRCNYIYNYTVDSSLRP